MFIILFLNEIHVTLQLSVKLGIKISLLSRLQSNACIMCLFKNNVIFIYDMNHDHVVAEFNCYSVARLISITSL